MKKSEGKKKTVTTRSRSKSDLSGIIDEVFLILDLDPDQHIITANKKFLKYSGYSLVDLKNKPIGDFFEINDVSQEKINSYWKTRDPNKKDLGSLQLNRKLNKFVNVRAEAIQVVDNEQKLKKIVLLLSETDTQTIGSEAEVQSVKDIPVDQMDQSQIKNIEKSIVLSRWNPEGYLIGANEVFQDLTGFGESQLYGRHVSAFVSDISDSGDDWSEAWRRASLGQVGHCCINMSHLNGTAHPVHMTLIADKDPDGHIIEFTGLGTEVTPFLEKINELTQRVNSLETDRIPATEAIATADFDLEGRFIEGNNVYLRGYLESSAIPLSMRFKHRRIFAI